MKFLTILMLLSFSLHAAETEGDLQRPVSDISEMTRQEQQETPQLNDVPIYERAVKKETKVKSKKKIHSIN